MNMKQIMVDGDSLLYKMGQWSLHTCVFLLDEAEEILGLTRSLDASFNQMQRNANSAADLLVKEGV